MTDSRFWSRLVRYINEGQVVPIVGQDLLLVPHEQGVQELYPRLARQLAEQLHVSGDGLPRGSELNEVAVRYLRAEPRGDLNEVYAELKIALETVAPALVPPATRREEHERTPAAESAIPAPLLQLAEIQSFGLYVSTTFDWGLADAVHLKRGERADVRSFWPGRRDDLPKVPTPKPVVFQLFGRLSSLPQYAVTEEDVLEFVHSFQAETKRPDRLLDELSGKQLLIIGCSIAGWLGRFFLRIARGERLSRAEQTSFLADLTVIEDTRLVVFLELMTQRVQVIDGGPIEFVKRLHGEWTRANPDAARRPAAAGDDDASAPTIEPGAVFLSYASEDAATVEQIKADLESLPVPVWFDKSAIRAGAEFRDKIRDGIDEASVFVPVISARTLERRDRYFRVEWDHAEERRRFKAEGESFVVPLVVDDTSPNEQRVPRWIRELSWRSYPQDRVEVMGLIRQLYREHQKSPR